MAAAHDDDYHRFDAQIVEFTGLAVDHPDRPRLQDALVRGFRPVAHHIARRFARRGEPVEDLEQVALIGLLRALERYDPTRGSAFLSFAVPTMMGEVRRHFRDHAWTVRTPRGVQERYLHVGDATATLAQETGRAPTTAEVAERLGTTVDDVLAVAAVGASYRPDSLDRPLTGGDDARPVDLMGDADPELDHVATRSVVRGMVARLPERERTVLVLRYVHEQSQREIAERLCISQMHVSRLLTRTLSLLRERVRHLGAEELAATVA